MKKLILITGVAGFIGSNVANRFIKEGFHVVGVDNLSGGKTKNIPEEVDFIKGDLSKNETINLLPNKCDQIIHLAGQSSGEISFDNPVTDLNKNTVSTLNLINYGIKKSSERIIYSSSMSVYGESMKKKVTEKAKCEPLSCYGVGKLMSEKYLNIFKKQIPFVSLRLSNVYGPGQDMDNLRQGMLSIYLSQAIKNKKIMIKGSLKRRRDFIFIDDVVEGSFDYKLGYAQDKDRKAEDYWGPVKELLDFVKNKLPNHKLLIAAHHRRNQNDIPISGNKFIFDKTCELIKDSKLILCHNSMASQLAVLFRKPIVFITTDFYKSYHFHSHLTTNSLSKALGTELINVGKKFQPNKKILQKIKSAKVDTEKYKKYEKNYINYPEFKSYGRWQAVLKHLDRIGT